jgi:hypothetical protein
VLKKLNMKKDIKLSDLDRKVLLEYSKLAADMNNRSITDSFYNDVNSNKTGYINNKLYK